MKIVLWSIIFLASLQASINSEIQPCRTWVHEGTDEGNEKSEGEQNTQEIELKKFLDNDTIPWRTCTSFIDLSKIGDNFEFSACTRNWTEDMFELDTDQPKIIKLDKVPAKISCSFHVRNSEPKNSNIDLSHVHVKNLWATAYRIAENSTIVNEGNLSNSSKRLFSDTKDLYILLESKGDEEGEFHAELNKRGWRITHALPTEIKVLIIGSSLTLISSLILLILCLLKKKYFEDSSNEEYPNSVLNEPLQNQSDTLEDTQIGEEDDVESGFLINSSSDSVSEAQRVLLKALNLHRSHIDTKTLNDKKKPSLSIGPWLNISPGGMIMNPDRYQKSQK